MCRPAPVGVGHGLGEEGSREPNPGRRVAGMGNEQTVPERAFFAVGRVAQPEQVVGTQAERRLRERKA